LIITEPQDILGPWLASRTKGRYLPGADFHIGNMRGDNLVAVCGFGDYNGASMRIHIAGEGNWLTRDYLRYCFDYAFNFVKVKKLIGLVESQNAKALRFDKHLGFAHEHTIKDGVPGGDLVILSMTRDQCRYID